MFGYIIINKPEIKFKDYDVYRSFYCGLCRELKKKFGISGQLSLTYDMTFVILLLNGLYETPVQKEKTRCIMHPFQKNTICRNEITEYAADMNVLLTYYKCMDDWQDEKKYLRFVYAKILEKKNKKQKAVYQKKAETIAAYLQELSLLEKAGEMDMDRMSGCFGKIMEEILAYKTDEWEKNLRKIGFFLGKFIYLLDAYEDVEQDVKKGCYNPFSQEYLTEGFEERIRQILILMLSETCREFEKLPIIKYADILRNILYSGVWCRFEKISVKRRETQERKNV